MSDKKLKTSTPRTDRQNRAMHLFFSLLATELNAGGYSVQLVLKEKMDLDWTSDSVKELLWRPAQKALLKKHSTTTLNKQEDITLIYEHLNRHLGTIFGVHVPWPHFEKPSDYDRFTAS